MRRNLTLAVLLLVTMALASTGAIAAAAGPHTTYTCSKTKNNGDTDVKLAVPEPAVGGLTNAGWSCVIQPSGDEVDGVQDADESDGETPKAGVTSISAVTLGPAPESRSLYCSTKGPVERGTEGPGVALNLPDSQGALLVEKGLASPAIFYAGLGVSCDLLPGFTYSGFWVDHVGDVVPGAVVYPYYVPTTS